MSVLPTSRFRRPAGALGNAKQGRAPAMHRSLHLLALLTLLTSVGCAERRSGNVRTVTPGTPATLVETCSPCSDDCVHDRRRQCIDSKVHTAEAKSGGCLVYCVGRPETVGKSRW